MGRLGDYWNRIIKRKKTEPLDVEELRIAFKARYHDFKLLLTANNRSLEIMAEMEEALRGREPFGMTFVLARCTQVSTSVFQMVKHLNGLSAGKYEALYGRFREIQEKVNSLLAPEGPAREGPLILPLQDVDLSLSDLAGGKIANLGEIRNRLNLKVPEGFVITAEAYRRFMTHNELRLEINRRIQAAGAVRLDQLYSLSADIQQLVMRSSLPLDLEQAILEHYHALEAREGTGIHLAMRSSALGEDIAGASFAGQYRSTLNVSGDNILDAYREIVAAKYDLPAMTYRLSRGILDEDVAMCVGCLRMVDAMAGGVVYSRNPVSPEDDSVLINSVWGLPKSVVDGSTPVDLFVVSRGEPMTLIRKEIPLKEQKLVCYPEEGICRMDMTGEEGRMPSLSDAQALELARLALVIEAHYKGPQDIEWAVDREGSLILLQCRPLQQLGSPKGQEARRNGADKPGRVLLEGGVTASPGTAAGPVFLAKREMDALQFPQGSILVLAQALPRWATLLSRASAVVSERGSVAGHLASVAREFRVPALFGVAGAMDSLTSGTEITVDADGRSIFEGRIEALLGEAKEPKNPMEGSRVYETLKEAARLVVPLNLLDPDSPQFKPAGCRTFHDITRFCHEKAVVEMFRFGKDHHFPERSSKQLFCQVPMQWWVLNLDDGFKEESEGRFVEIDNIVSIPMLAIWKGITALPWEGPPPMDGKGFLSVMFEATRNTALTTGVRTKYADQNYFMISKNYCSLNSRLGFHFSILETLVSDRPSENYVSFQFKGGAADFARRMRRILFLRKILEECGFRVEVREDALIARLENYERPFMEGRLKILGYLTIHTRQLDMIMASPASVDHYRSKIRRDIEVLLSE